MIAGFPTLIIGVGGTGLQVLQRVKDRLLETYYGEVPSRITLLEFDTTQQRPNDNFCGVHLDEQDINTEGGSRNAELYLIQSPQNYDMNSVFSEARQGRKRWDWLEVTNLDDQLTPAQKQIANGAAAYRPVGRTAFFLNYTAVRTRLLSAMRQVMRGAVTVQAIDIEFRSQFSDINAAQTLRNVFLVGSLAGGTGSGALLDLAAMIRDLKRTNQAEFGQIQLIGVIALPSFFTDVPDQERIGRRISNSYAGLRELDRLFTTHKIDNPYVFVGGDDQQISIEEPLFDLCYLVDKAGFNGQAPGDGRPEHGGVPAIADWIVAHTDQYLGLRINEHLINDPTNYQERGTITPLPYSALNNHTIIFPREDAARSLSLRFLLELIDERLIKHDQRGDLLVPTDPMSVPDVLTKVLKLAEPKATNAADATRADLKTAGKLGPFLRAILSPETNLRTISGEDESVIGCLVWLIEDANARNKDEKLLKDEVGKTTKPPADRSSPKSWTKIEDAFINKNLGELVNPDERFGERQGGVWYTTLEQRVTEQRASMEAAIDSLVIRILNQRVQENETSLLRPNRIGYAMEMLRALKSAVREFVSQAEKLKVQDNRQNLRITLANLRQKKVETFSGPAIPGIRPHPGPQYFEALTALAKAERKHLLLSTIISMATVLGGDIVEHGRNRSVLDTAIAELERWVRDLKRVRQRIAEARGGHEARRQEKYRIAVRTYITDPARVPHAKTVEEELYARYKPLIEKSLLGPSPEQDDAGPALVWEKRGDRTYFDYQITTKQKAFQLNPQREPVKHVLLDQGSNPEEIAEQWMKGAFRLLAEQVRFDPAARVGPYIRQLYRDHVAVRNMLEKHNYALTRLNGAQPDPERLGFFLSVNTRSDDQELNAFYGRLRAGWDGGKNVFFPAETEVACSYTTFYHGLRLEQIQGFTECLPHYQKVEFDKKCSHLFPEERQSAVYESLVRASRRSDWNEVRRLHPAVVMGLRDPDKVRDFALAYLASLIQDEAVQIRATRTLTLRVGDKPVQLAVNFDIPNYNALRGPNDKLSVLLLRAFQTFTVLGRAITDTEGNNLISYGAVSDAIERWFSTEYGILAGDAFNSQIERWEKEQGTNDKPSFFPLFNSESRDPRFRDLGVVLLLELNKMKMA